MSKNMCIKCYKHFDSSTMEIVQRRDDNSIETNINLMDEDEDCEWVCNKCYTELVFDYSHPYDFELLNHEQEEDAV